MTANGDRWLIVGAHGMLGTDLMELLAERGARATGIDHIHLDITDPDACAAYPIGADVVVNCAAYTAVDAAEEDEDRAFAVNATGAGNIARAAAAAGATFVHISTDYVFAGDATTPYAEGEPPAPTNAYGRTKAAGEAAVARSAPDALIVRTAWLYGANGPCFPKTIKRLAGERDQLAVVGDQRGQPTWTRDLAAFIVDLVEAGAPAGIYHGTASGETTWCEFARAVVDAAGLPTAVAETTTDAFPRPASRPAYSVLGHAASDALGVPAIGPWAERWAIAAPAVLAN